MAVLSLTDLEAKLVVACADGSASVSQLKPDGLEPIREWTERRLSAGQKYIGLAASSTYVIHSISQFSKSTSHLVVYTHVLQMVPSV